MDSIDFLFERSELDKVYKCKNVNPNVSLTWVAVACLQHRTCQGKEEKGMDLTWDLLHSPLYTADSSVSSCVDPWPAILAF